MHVSTQDEPYRYLGVGTETHKKQSFTVVALHLRHQALHAIKKK